MCLMPRRIGDDVLYSRNRRYSAGADAILDKVQVFVEQFPPLLFVSRFFSVDLTAFYHRLPIVTQNQMVEKFEIRKDVELVRLWLIPDFD